jgi:hypothetical protein
MGVVLFFLPTTSTLLSTIGKALGGFAIYVVFLLLIDMHVRELVGEIWAEIKSTLKQLTHRENSVENVSKTSEN